MVVIILWYLQRWLDSVDGDGCLRMTVMIRKILSIYMLGGGICYVGSIGGV